MGAVGHLRGADSAFLFVTAATDDKLPPKCSTKDIRIFIGSYRVRLGGGQM